MNDHGEKSKPPLIGIQPWQHWCCQLLLIVLLAGWIAFDPLFPLQGLEEGSAAASPPLRSIGLCLLLVTGAAHLVSLIIGLVIGSPSYRSLRALLAIATVVGLWLSLAISYQEIAWQGQRARLAWQLEDFESLAQSLARQWPSEDGEHDSLGPFMAYPFGRPRTLILLTPPQIDASGTVIAAVERREDGSLMFQLAGVTSQQDWLEWHPAGQPDSFVGGLDDAHLLVRSTELSNGWHLVRYES